MEYIVNIIDSLAWPITLLIIMFSLKKPLTALLPNINKLKYKDLEIDFAEKLNELSEKTKEKQTSLKIKNSDEKPNYYEIQIEKLSPRIAIIESWVSLELTARSTLEIAKITKNSKKSAFSQIILLLKEHKLIEEEDIKILKDLLVLRNNAMHELNFTISKEEAKQFMEIARNQEDIILGNYWQIYRGCNH